MKQQKTELSSISYWLNQLTQEIKGLKEEVNHLNYRLKKQTNKISPDKYDEVKNKSNSWWSSKD